MHKYRVGDVVTVRSFKDMASEFGENDGRIENENIAFVPEMKELCNQEFEVDKLVTERRYGFTRYIYELKGTHWKFMDWMLVDCTGDDVNFEELSGVSIDDILTV